MPSTHKWVSHTKATKGVDRSNEAHNSDPDTWFDTNDVWFRHDRIGTFPSIVPYNTSTPALTRPYFSGSNEDKESLILLGNNDAYYSYTTSPLSQAAAVIINRVAQPTDDSVITGLCAITNVEQPAGFGTASQVDVEITTNGTPDKVTVSVAGVPLAAYTDVVIPDNFQLRVQVTTGNYVTFSGASAVAGLTLNGEYQIVSIVGVDDFRCIWGSAATS